MVCSQWKQSFTNFLADMGRKPTSKHSLDRINNDGNYEPSNIRFVTVKVNINNGRKLRTTNTTGYRGVTLRENGKFRASVKVSGYPQLNKSGFDNAVDAATFRDRHCIFFGIKTPMNFPQNLEEAA